MRTVSRFVQHLEELVRSGHLLLRRGPRRGDELPELREADPVVPVLVRLDPQPIHDELLLGVELVPVDVAAVQTVPELLIAQVAVAARVQAQEQVPKDLLGEHQIAHGLVATGAILARALPKIGSR